MNNPRNGIELTSSQQQSLRRIVALMIPASTEQGMPSANDELIFADILASLDRDAPAVHAALEQLDKMANGAFHALPADAQQTVIDAFRRQHPGFASVLVAVTVRCYYRDDRVMRAIGMEPRPPYPKGFAVEQGDWSLLDPVRARGPIWRRTN